MNKLGIVTLLLWLTVNFTMAAQASTISIIGPNGETKTAPMTQYGPTLVDDTLWRIATNHSREHKLDVYQTLAAIYKANPHAFVRNNINVLEVGVILAIPNAEDINATPRLPDANIYKHIKANSNKTSKPKISLVPAKLEQDLRDQIKQLQQELAANQLQLAEVEKKYATELEDLLEQQELLEQQKQNLLNRVATSEELIEKAEARVLISDEKSKQLADRMADIQTELDNYALQARKGGFWQSLLENIVLVIALMMLIVISAALLIWKRLQLKEPEQDLSVVPSQQQYQQSQIDEANSTQEETEQPPQAVKAETSMDKDVANLVKAEPEALTLDSLDDIETQGQVEAFSMEDTRSLDALWEEAMGIEAQVKDEQLQQDTKEQKSVISSETAPLDEQLEDNQNVEITEVENPNANAEDFTRSDIEFAAIDNEDMDMSEQKDMQEFIDIDKLLDEAKEVELEKDPYDDVSIDFSNIDKLIEDNPQIDVDSEENTVNAKLDLAKAYIEIEDIDNAITLLEEVVSLGNAEQQAEANELKQSLEK